MLPCSGLSQGWVSPLKPGGTGSHLGNGKGVPEVGQLPVWFSFKGSAVMFLVCRWSVVALLFISLF